MPFYADPREPFYNKAYWRKKFCWKPRRCAVSNKILWLRYAMEGVAMWPGPTEVVFEYRYHGIKEHVMWRISS